MSKRVLVVDDDPDVRLFSVTVLEENGYTPLEADNGETGLYDNPVADHDLGPLQIIACFTNDDGINAGNGQNCKNIDIGIHKSVFAEAFSTQITGEDHDDDQAESP